MKRPCGRGTPGPRVCLTPRCSTTHRRTQGTRGDKGQPGGFRGAHQPVFGVLAAIFWSRVMPRPSLPPCLLIN